MTANRQILFSYIEKVVKILSNNTMRVESNFKILQARKAIIQDVYTSSFSHFFWEEYENANVRDRINGTKMEQE
uniref:Uncharacterized protein n=1 Tax=Caenorhabditis japonica TaxID=281687 RepID=A0A8R1ELW6_CAEJA